MRYKIEFYYARQPGKHVYDVDLGLYEEGRDDVFESVLDLTFMGVDLQDACARLHHLIRLMEGRGELAVDLIQKQHRMHLTVAEINRIRESEDSARLFFAPTIIARERKTDAAT
jgi:hypothetical protein